MATVVFKLFAGQGTGMDGQMDGQSGDYMLPPFGGHHDNCFYNDTNQ